MTPCSLVDMFVPKYAESYAFEPEISCLLCPVVDCVEAAHGGDESESKVVRLELQFEDHFSRNRRYLFVK